MSESSHIEAAALFHKQDLKRLMGSVDLHIQIAKMHAPDGSELPHLIRISQTLVDVLRDLESES